MSRLIAAAVTLYASLAFAVVAERGDLVSYSFDDGRVETGPDTFIVFEHAKGRVDLSEDFYFTPYESVVIEDVPGNGAFPELQGFFPQVDDGKLFVQFYLMPTQRDQELNVALAGSVWFNVEPQGIALWLIFRDGMIQHVSDWIPQVLVPRFEPFQWYRFDVVYDVGRGTYDISVGIADEPPFVSLRHQPNAPGSPGSGVGIFSFIGDLRDRSSVRYYIDSLNIGRNDIFARKPGASAAPAPRRSLVDREIDLLRTELDALSGFLPIRGASQSGRRSTSHTSPACARTSPTIQTARSSCSTTRSRRRVRAWSARSASTRTASCSSGQASTRPHAAISPKRARPRRHSPSPPST